MMSDDDDIDYSTTKKSSGNLATLFRGGDPTAPITAYVPPKQPKKDVAPRVMIATVIQAFSYGADQKWSPKGKMCVALLSTENTNFQLIIYVSKAQQITSLRLSASTVFTPQSNNYLSFQDDSNQNWSIMFDTKQGLVDFALQVVLAKAYLLSFKFEHISQDIREGEGSVLADNDSAEVNMNAYKVLENGTIQPNDPSENKPMKFKIGKNLNGKAFDDVLRGMKKGGQRVSIIGGALYNIEVTRIKREKDARSSSTTAPPEEPIPVETKRVITEEQETENERARLIQRMNRMGGVSMMHHQHPTSAFVTSIPHHFSDDDSITHEYIQNIGTPRTISTPVPPVQFVQAGYHHPMHPQSLIQQPNMYPPQQQPGPMQDYMGRPGSSMTGMPYQQAPMWPQSQYPSQPTQNVPPTDMYYQNPAGAPQPPPPPAQTDFRQLLTRLNEKVDTLTEKFDSKNSANYPNMETSILLANIQRIVKENEAVKKDLYDRSTKIEELNSKISELLDRNQRLIEQRHHTASERNDVVQNVSEQTAQKILELEKQKVDLTTNLSDATSKIADLKLQLSQSTQGTNENQSRLTSLSQKCEQYRDDLQKSDSQRLEIQTKFDTAYEQYKNEKSARKQLQTQLNTLEEEFTELKGNYANLEKVTNERKSKYENERKRWQDDLDEQKQGYEKELDELRSKLRKQRTTDNLSNNQELTRIEKDLEKEWQEKLERQQTNFDKSLNNKTKELEVLKTTIEENETKLAETIAELDQTKEELEAYQERCEKFQERLALAKERMIEMNDEQSQLATDQVRQVANIIFQRLKTRIQSDKQYTGEQVLSRSLEIIKKATLKVLSNDDDDEEEDEEEEEEEEEEDEKEQENNDEPTNGKFVDQQTLNEEVASVQSNPIVPDLSSTTINPKNGWDTVDDLPPEPKTPEEQNQIIIQTTEESKVTDETFNQENNLVEENKETSNVVTETTENVIPTDVDQTERKDSDASVDTIEENTEKPSETVTVLELPAKKSESGDDDDDEIFTSARPSIQTNPPPATSIKTKFGSNIPSNPDDSDDDLFK